MSATAHPVRYSWHEYVTFEKASNVKHEYLDGQIYAMAGGTPDHAALQTAFPSVLFATLRRGPCRAHSSDLRVRVLATGLATYPDVTIVRGPREVDTDGLSVLNPTLVVEVLSPSSEDYDRGEKFAHYKRIPTLRQYVLVAQDQQQLEVWTRGPDDAWACRVSKAGESADLASVGATLEVRELYEAAAEGKPS